MPSRWSAIAVFIFYEAWQRFLHPRAVAEWTMFWVALAASRAEQRR